MGVELLRGGEQHGDVAVGADPGGFGDALVRQGVVDEEPRVVCDRVFVKCEGASGFGVLEGAAGGGGVLSDDVAESCFGFVAGGGLSTRGYGKIRHCNA